MTDASTWAAIGLLAGALIALVGLVPALVLPVVRAEAARGRAETRELIGELRADLRVLDTRFDAVERDVRRLRERVFAGEGGEQP